MPLSLLLALAANPAQAESEIVFRTARPVLIFVDGRQTPLTSNLRMRASDLEAGAHEITVKGVFGKTLYEGEIELADWTVAHAEWADGELEVFRTETIERRGQRGRRASPWADEPEEAPEDGVAEEVPEELVVDEAAIPAAESVDEEGAAEPEAPAEPEALAELDAVDAPLAVPVVAAEGIASEAVEAPAEIETVDAVLTDKVPAPSMRIQAREGVRLELVAGEAVLTVTVRDGAFVLDVSE